MVKLNVADIQGFVLRGYNFPFARYLLLELDGPEKGRDFVGQIIPHITTGQRWESKPQSTVNISFTHKGLVRLGLPDATLLSFPVEFFQGMKARKEILCDTGRNACENWDEVWRKDVVHVWLGVNALTPAALDERCAEMESIMQQTGGARLLQAQDAKAIFIDGKPCSKEHFGYTDGFGNPDFDGAERHSQPGQGKLTKDGEWVPLATGEFVLGYPDEAGELPVAPRAAPAGAITARSWCTASCTKTWRRFGLTWMSRAGITRAARRNSLPRWWAAGATVRRSSFRRTLRTRR